MADKTLSILEPLEGEYPNRIIIRKNTESLHGPRFIYLLH